MKYPDNCFCCFTATAGDSKGLPVCGECLNQLWQMEAEKRIELCAKISHAYWTSRGAINAEENAKQLAEWLADISMGLQVLGETLSEIEIPVTDEDEDDWWRKGAMTTNGQAGA